LKEMNMNRRLMTLIITGFLILAVAGTALAENPNPRVVPNNGLRYGELGARWWQWAFSFPAADVPYYNTGGPVDISAHQSGNVWFLAGANNGLETPRTGTVPAGTSLFFPLFNLINDYPCPPEFGFEPPPGETLEHFLQRTGNEFLDVYYVPDPSKLIAEIDGASVTDLPTYRATSSMFTFTADPALASGDPCITGNPQPGVAVGYWLLLPPLTPGEHILHFGAPSYGQDIKYILTVTPGN
jgi:hypothetical protein